MKKDTQNFSVNEIMYWMYYNNMGKIFIHYRTHIEPDALISYVPLEDLKIPNGWYFTKKNMLTNKNNSSNGDYAVVPVKIMIP